MNQAGVGFLRWGVVLGLLVALPALALREKWGNIAELFVRDDIEAKFLSQIEIPDNQLQFSPLSHDAGAMSAKSATPDQRPDQFLTRGDIKPAPQVLQSQLELPQSAKLRNLRVCVYRPLSSGDDQNIQRVPALAEDTQDRVRH